MMFQVLLKMTFQVIDKVQLYEKSKCHEFDDIIEIELYKLFIELCHNLGVTYMSYTFDYMNKIRYSFRSDPLWAKTYDNEKYNGLPLIEQCPLDIFSRQSKNLILVWDDFVSREQPRVYREIMGMRTDIGLCHGITLSTYFGKHHDAIAVASEEYRDNLAMRILLNNKKNVLTKFLLSCRKKIITHYLMGE